MGSQSSDLSTLDGRGDAAEQEQNEHTEIKEETMKHLNTCDPNHCADGCPLGKTGSYRCPFCGKDSIHSHEARLAYAIPNLFETLCGYRRLFLHLASLYSRDPEVQSFSPYSMQEALNDRIADIKHAYQSEMHEQLVPLEGMRYDSSSVEGKDK